MASRHLASLLRSRLSSPSLLLRNAVSISRPNLSDSTTTPLPQLSNSLLLRRLATASSRRAPPRPNRTVDIGARARQIQSRRLWTYALTFSGVAGFIILVLNNFQDAMVFYITPSEALEKYLANPTRNRFRLGGLVLEGSVAHPADSNEMEFVITDLMTDMLVKYEGEVPDLFREGHSVVVEGFVKEFESEKERGKGVEGEEGRTTKATEKARNGDCYFKAVEVLAKHDEKYMPKVVADALERNKKIIEADQAATAAAAHADSSSSSSNASKTEEIRSK